MKQFPEILRAWMGERTLTAAASALNVGISTLHAWLAGTNFPRHRQVGDLAARLGMTEPELHEAIARTRNKAPGSSITPTEPLPCLPVIPLSPDEAV